MKLFLCVFSLLFTFFWGGSTPFPFIHLYLFKSSLSFNIRFKGYIFQEARCDLFLFFMYFSYGTYLTLRLSTSSCTLVTSSRGRLAVTSQCLNFLPLVNFLHLINLCWIELNVVVIWNVPDSFLKNVSFISCWRGAVQRNKGNMNWVGVPARKYDVTLLFLQNFPLYII